MDHFAQLKSFIKDYQEKTFDERLKEQKVDVSKIKRLGEIKASTIDVKNRTVEFIATKEVVDRHGDVVKVTGISIDNYIKNPVVLFGHDYGGLPVAKAIGVKFDGDELIIKAQFIEKSVYEFADTVFQMIVGGFLSAVSIGFIPIQEAYNSDQGGFVIEKSELLELSVVPVPANAEALAKGYKTIIKDAEGEGIPPKAEEKEEDDPLEEEKEEIDEKIFKHNVEILKIYRNYQILLRAELGIEPTEDEEETTKKGLEAAYAVVRMVKAKCSEENPTENPDKPPKAEENPEPEEKSLVDIGLKAVEQM